MDEVGISWSEPCSPHIRGNLATMIGGMHDHVQPLRCVLGSKWSWQGTASAVPIRTNKNAGASQSAEKLTNLWITVEERPFRACPEPVEGAA